MYYDEALTRPAGTGFSAGQAGNITLYAKWTGNLYHIGLNGNDDAVDSAVLPSDTADVVFGESFTLPLPTRTGYIFNGWKTSDGNLLTTADGNSIAPWGIADDAALYADWTRKIFYLQVNANGTLKWLGENGFSDTVSAIPYGTEFASATELEAAFNAGKVSLKEGHKFDYFTLPGSDIRFGFWDKLPDLGADGTTFEISAHFTPEINFSIAFEGEQVGDDNPLTAEFGALIALPRPVREGKTFVRWVVSDSYLNSRYQGTSLASGLAFDRLVMPDLSPGVEEDGATIRLAAEYAPNPYEVSFVSPYGTAPSSVEVMFESEKTLPIVSGLVGRTFAGWYTEPNGNGTQIADASGRMVSVWSYPNNKTLYAKLNLINYSITYNLNGGSFSSAPPTSYTVATNTITLTPPGQAYCRFAGWYADSAFSGDRIYQIPKGSTGNKIYYAKWEILYSLLFTEGDTHSILLAYGETVTLPTVAKDYYDGVWMGTAITGGATYSNLQFGASFTLTTRSDIRFSVKWTGKIYKILFNNLHGSSCIFNTHRYGENTVLQDPYVSGASGMNVFRGFYSDSNFITRITYISANIHEDIAVYLKWDLWHSGLYRSWAETITDSGRFKQPYDKTHPMFFLSNHYNEFEYIKVVITLTAWEKDDGYQWLFLYDGEESSSNCLWELKFEHYPGQKSGTKKTYTFEKLFERDKLNTETICVRYGASGSGSDTWYNEQVQFDFYFVHD